MRRFRSRRANGDRGVAMIEMAIVAPFLAFLLAGIFEFGTLWRDDLTVSTSTRAAARVVSNLGDDHRADYWALLSLHAGLETVNGLTIEGVLIYNANAVDGDPPSNCFDSNGDPRGASGCNYYTAAELSSITSLNCEMSCSEFPDDASCNSGWAVNFCPQDERSTSQIAGLTSVGVWVRVSREYLTGVFPGDGVTITDRTVMRSEPDST
ncbi:MAG: hypothetical protein ACI9C1_001579 [Candidatus Aldehydirespiratoraceae bacterium]